MKKISLISILFVICISLFPSLGTTEDAYILNCHKITGECFSLDRRTDSTLEFFGQRKLDEYETISIAVKPVLKIKESLTEEEKEKIIPLNEVALAILINMKGLKFFRQIEKYPNGRIKAESTGYGISKNLIEYCHGKRVQWWENGQKQIEADCAYGYTEGKVTSWYESGIKGDEAYVHENKLHGVRKIYDTKGNLLYVDTYENNEKKNRKAYTSEGKLKFDQDY